MPEPLTSRLPVGAKLKVHAPGPPVLLVTVMSNIAVSSFPLNGVKSAAVGGSSPSIELISKMPRKRSPTSTVQSGAPPDVHLEPSAFIRYSASLSDSWMNPGGRGIGSAEAASDRKAPSAAPRMVVANFMNAPLGLTYDSCAGLEAVIVPFCLFRY